MFSSGAGLYGPMAAAALIVVSSAASAQTPGHGLTTPPPTSNTLRFGGTAGDFQRRLASEALERERNATPTTQEALITRVAPLVAEGRCEAARRLARQEGDRAVSRRIGAVCVEGRPTPMDQDPSA